MMASSIAKLSFRVFSTSSSKSIRRFSPSNHLWLEAAPTPTACAQDAMIPKSMPCTGNSDAIIWDIKIGITERGFDDLGDIENIEPLFSKAPSQTETACTTSSPVILTIGDPILQISWHGHLISQADELYHTTWETIEGNHIISSPLTGKVKEIATDECWDKYGEDTWFARLLVKEKSFKSLLDGTSWISEEKYVDIIKRAPKGAFADDG